MKKHHISLLPANISGRNLPQTGKAAPIMIILGILFLLFAYSCKDNSLSISSINPEGTVTGLIVDKSTAVPTTKR